MTNNQLVQLERTLSDAVEGIRILLESEPVNASGEYVDTRANDIEYLAASIQDVAVGIARIRTRSVSHVNS